MGTLCTVCHMDLKTWIDQQPGTNRQTIKWIADQLGLSDEAVLAWVYRRHRVPAARCKAVERVTGGEVKAERLRPDVFVGEEPAA